jgi:hypothetical protein
MINATPTQLRKAADIQEKIESLQNELGQLLGGEVPTPVQTTVAPKKRKMSTAGRRAIAAAAKARWAKFNAEKGGPVKKAKRKMSAQGLANIRAGVVKRMAAQGKALSVKSVKKARKKISAAGLANIRAAQKARWAKAKAAGKA